MAGFRKSHRGIFHEVEYLVEISGDDQVLVVESEQSADGERWRGQFSSQFIEEITRRTGNFKPFSVFLKMLVSAMDRDSESVYLDVLTSRDLEMLRQRASGPSPTNGGPPGTDRGPQQTQQQSNKKRYLILTYQAEFDKVHYPLALTLEEANDDPETLKSCVQRLKANLKEAHGRIATLEEYQGLGGQQRGGGESDHETAREVAELRRENERLRSEIRIRDQAQNPAVDQARERLARAQAELKALREEKTRESASHKKEKAALEKELSAAKAAERRLQARTRQLEQDLERGGGFRGRGVSPAGSRGGSRPPSRPPSRAPSREPSRPPSRQPSRPASACSSVTSSRERNFSPSQFLRAGEGAAAAAAARQRSRTPSPSAYLRTSDPRAGAGGGPPLASRYNNVGNEPRRGRPGSRTPSPSRIAAEYTNSYAPREPFGMDGGGRSYSRGSSRGRSSSPQNRRDGGPPAPPLPKHAQYSSGSPYAQPPLGSSITRGRAGSRSASPADRGAPGRQQYQDPAGLLGLTPGLLEKPSGRRSRDPSPTSAHERAAPTGGGGGRLPPRPLVGVGEPPGAQPESATTVPIKQYSFDEEPHVASKSMPQPETSVPVEVADIDARLAALQNFLRNTKSVA